MVCQIQVYIFSDDGNANHSAELICQTAIEIHTQMRNQCSAVVGINVMYFVILKK